MITFKNRRDMVRALIPTGSVIAELGVLCGTFSKDLISTKPKKLHLVDLWQEGLTIEEDGVLVEKKPRESLLKVFDDYSDNIGTGQVEIHICDAIEFLKNFQLDAAYIDDLHTYDHLLQELFLCRAGLIFVHDYCEVFPEVVKAVDDFVRFTKSNVVGITNEEKNIVWPRLDNMPEYVSYNTICIKKNFNIGPLI